MRAVVHPHVDGRIYCPSCGLEMRIGVDEDVEVLWLSRREGRMRALGIMCPSCRTEVEVRFKPYSGSRERAIILPGSRDAFYCPGCGRIIRHDDDDVEVVDVDGTCCGDLYGITLSCPSCGQEVEVRF